MNKTLDKDDYYNKTAFYHILFISLFYLVCAIWVFDYEVLEDYSFAFYVNIAFTSCYLFCSNTGIPSEFDVEKNCKAASDFSLGVFCLWVGFVDYFCIEGTPSSFSALFIFAGMVSVFTFFAKAQFIIKERFKSDLFYFISLSSIKLLILMFFVMAGLILLNSNWDWDIYSPYQMLSIIGQG